MVFGMIEVVKTKLEAHIEEHYRFREQVMTDLGKLMTNMDEKVSYKHFTWVIGILISILIAISGYMSGQLSHLAENVTVVKQDVATVRGKLEPYEVEFKK